MSEKRVRRSRIGKRSEYALLLLLLPSLLGLTVFYIAPFIVSFYNAVIDNPVDRNFAGLQNFADILASSSFRTALANTAVFTGICVPLNLILPLLLAMALRKAKFGQNTLWVIFLLPLVIPSGAIVTFWRNTFGYNGWINGLFYPANPQDWMKTPAALAVVVFIFIWKNAGYNMILFYAGLNNIPKEYYECASVEGAGAGRQFRSITMVYLAPAAFLAFIMAFINSFKVFKEIYMMSGAYPDNAVYMIQHYMYNQFTSANYQKLAASSYIVTAIFVVIVVLLYRIQKRISENF